MHSRRSTTALEDARIDLELYYQNKEVERHFWNSLHSARASYVRFAKRDAEDNIIGPGRGRPDFPRELRGWALNPDKHDTEEEASKPLLMGFTDTMLIQLKYAPLLKDFIDKSVVAEKNLKGE